MAQALPLKVRVGIRDTWDSPTSSVQKASDALFKTLGCKISPVVEWPALWAEMGERYEADKGQFVPAIESIVITWYNRLEMKLNNDVDSKWTEDFLSAITETPSCEMKLHVQLGRTGHSRPTTQCVHSPKSFSLYIPTKESTPLSTVISAFDADFKNILKADHEEEWADITNESGAAVSSSTAAKLVISEPLPSVDMLPRPDELFKSTTPYFLIVDISKNPFIFVQSSHQASLELMSAYFKKWGKRNNFQNDDWPTSMRITPQDSLYTFGVMDSLLFEPFDRNIIANPTMILAFIEGVLRYKMVHTTGTYWVYKSNS